jgi:hypothetical protein
MTSEVENYLGMFIREYLQLEEGGEVKRDIRAYWSPVVA